MNLRRLLVLLVLGLPFAASGAELTASTPGVRTPTPPLPTPTPFWTPVPPPASFFDVPYAETSATTGNAIRTPSCFAGVGSFVFQSLRDGRVQMNRSFDHPAQGAVMRNPSETASGTWDGSRLVLRGTYDEGGYHKHVNPPVRYALRWDRDSGHLVGTRNDVAIRLAPLEVHAPDCHDMSPPPSQRELEPPPAPAEPVLWNEAGTTTGTLIRNVSDCRTIVGGWHFLDVNGTVHMSRAPDGRVLGFAPPPAETESGVGSWSAGMLSIRGTAHHPDGTSEPVTYELRRTSDGQLTGTRNGAPLRLAPTEIRGPDCSHEPPVP